MTVGPGSVDPSSAYARLGVRSGAGLAEVKHAYRRLARAHHPDTGGPAASEQILLEVVAAYQAIRAVTERRPAVRAEEERGAAEERGSTGWLRQVVASAYRPAEGVRRPRIDVLA
jgi:curved DNA-binding protein CbpA